MAVAQSYKPRTTEGGADHRSSFFYAMLVKLVSQLTCNQPFRVQVLGVALSNEGGAVV